MRKTEVQGEGEILRRELGLDYDPQTGRWTTKGPSRFGGGLTFYGYANNDPVNFNACPAQGMPVGSYHSHLLGHLTGPSPTDLRHAACSEMVFGEFHGYISGPSGELISYDRTGLKSSTPGMYSRYEISP